MRFSGHTGWLRGRGRCADERSSCPFPTVLAFGVASALLLLTASPSASAEPSGISSVSVSRRFFNATLGEKAEISFSVASAGSLTLLVLDRDGYVVRKLVSGRSVKPGKLSFTWDGRDDDSGEIVPDEAYSLKVDLRSGGTVDSYFPANRRSEEVQVAEGGYDRQRGIISYRLPKASRVFAKASAVRMAAGAGQPELSASRIIVNWEPRVGGAIVEQWNGYDGMGKVNILEKPDSAITIEARALPENALITIGNRQRTFRERVAKRRGTSLLTRRGSSS